MELELIAERLAKLVLTAHALAARMLGAPSTPERDERVRRVRAGAELGRHALDALLAPPGTPAARG